MTIDFEALAAPFEPTDLDWRVGNKSKKGDKATLLVYLTSRAVMNRLDEVVGPAGWRDAYTPLFEGGKIVGYLCELSVQVEPGVWVSKVDGADNTDMEAIKGGLSSALKRAAVKFGIGRYLYDVGSRFLPILAGYGPDETSVPCTLGPPPPRGQKDDNPPGHVMIPRLDAKFLPKPKTKGKKGAIDATPSAEDQALADRIAAEKEAARVAKEAEEAARKAKHHPSFEADRASYSAAVSKLGLNVDLVADLCEHMGRPRPSAMEPLQRAALVKWLNGDEGKRRYEDFRHERAEIEARGAA